MTSTPDLVSVVIPTHNRAASLARTLAALALQTSSGARTEIIVVADGCTDGTATVAVAQRAMNVRLVEQPALGPAAARNHGAAAATGDLLIFLDDDIEPCRGFVEAHVRAHEDGDPRHVAIGYLPPSVQGRRDFFAVMLRAWWEAMFERMREPGHRFTYSDLLSGNFSLRRSLFDTVGGFDETLRCHEDYELGFRLVSAGARLRFVPAAAGRHHDHTNLRRALRRKRDEGRADVALVQRHPALGPVLPFSAAHRHLTVRGRVLRKLALVAPGAGDRLEAACRTHLRVLEGFRLRGRWRRVLDDLLSYWYWRGVGDALAGEAVSTLRRPACPCKPYDLDLQVGLQASMQQLDAASPDAVTLRWGAWFVGTVNPQPGAERLQGRHLPALLRHRFANEFEETLALIELLASATPAPVASSRESASLHRV